MFNLVTGDDSIFYLNGWRVAGAGRSDTEGSECSGVHWSASSDPVCGPPATLPLPLHQHQTPPRLGPGITPLNEWNLTRS